MLYEEKVWAEKYRPTTVDETILPEDIKELFRGFVKNNFVPNLILSGRPGTGKTTIAKAALAEIGADVYVVNGSLDNGIDKIRYDIANFASSVSMMSEGRKYVIIDEADWLTNAAQAAFRGFIQDFSSTCGFIFTCNYKNKLFKELHSRFKVIDFDAPKEEQPKLATQFFKRVINILETEGVKYTKDVVAELVKKTYPDFRKTLVELQSYASRSENTIDIGILSSWNMENIKELFSTLKAKDFDKMREWVSSNSTKDYTNIYRGIYDHAMVATEKNTLPNLIVILSRYSFQHMSVADPEINLVAFLVEIMYECEFK